MKPVLCALKTEGSSAGSKADQKAARSASAGQEPERPGKILVGLSARAGVAFAGFGAKIGSGNGTQSLQVHLAAFQAGTDLDSDAGADFPSLLLSLAQSAQGYRQRRHSGRKFRRPWVDPEIPSHRNALWRGAFRRHRGPDRRVRAGSSWNFLLALSLVFLLLVIINGLFKFVINTSKGRMGERMLRRLRYELSDRVLRFPIPHLRKGQTGRNRDHDQGRSGAPGRLYRRRFHLSRLSGRAGAYSPGLHPGAIDVAWARLRSPLSPFKPI